MIFFLWLAFVIITVLAAVSRKRSGIAWFIWGVLFGPFALIAVLVMGQPEAG
ncbi:MAG: hypothetical protein KUG74_07375 [Rhodobacteraceae bacterium]|nr:hypothetical protein [Paracoccaceae bacterium]